MCNDCCCTGWLDLFFWHLWLLKTAKIYIFFSNGPTHLALVVTVCVFVSVNYSGNTHGHLMSQWLMMLIVFSIFFLQLTRWFHPTAEKRPQRKSVIPRWQNDWSKSNNACLEPTADETWDGKPCVKDATEVWCSLSSLIHWMQIDRMNCACWYLECHSED